MTPTLLVAPMGSDFVVYTLMRHIRGVGNQHCVICHAREYRVWNINAMLSVLHGNTRCGKSTLHCLSYTGIQGVENQHYIICHTREYRVWKINTTLSVIHGNYRVWSRWHTFQLEMGVCYIFDPLCYGGHKHMSILCIFVVFDVFRDTEWIYYNNSIILFGE